MSETTIYLVRHGEVYNPNEVFYGRLPRFGLSNTGRAEAQAAGQHLAQQPISAIFTSPMLRTRQTAKIIESNFQHDLPIRRNKKLIEIHSPYDGQPLSILREKNWDVYSDIAPHFEQPKDILGRVQNWMAQARKNHIGQQVIGVSHGDNIMYSILWALGLPLTLEAKNDVAHSRLGAEYLHTASVSRFKFNTADPTERPTFEHYFASQHG